MNKNKGLRILHLSDLHVQNLKYQEEYKTIFEELYKKVKVLDPDGIVITGDIFHSKTPSSEAYDMVSKLLKSLADIKKTYVLCGNHDMNVRNKDRLDSITPVVDTLQHPNIEYLKYSSIHHIKDNFYFNVLSLFDEDNWVPSPKDDGNVYISLYHGVVSGSQTEFGYKFEKGQIDDNILYSSTFGLLGDIHLRQALGGSDRFWMAGSLIATNFGETEDKGFLVWDIEDKDEYNIEFVKLNNPHPFINVKAEELDDKIDSLRSARVRLITEQVLTKEEERNIKFKINQQYPYSIKFHTKVKKLAEDVMSTSDGLTGDVRIQSVQERLFEEFVGDALDERELKELLELNKQYSALLEQEETARGTTWKVKTLEWDNLFNYGEGNKIDFEKLQGNIVGILGNNYSGKCVDKKTEIEIEFDEEEIINKLGFLPDELS